MPKGWNTCQWLALSSTQLCGKSCLGVFCKIHLARLRKGQCACQRCGVGVKTALAMCKRCGSAAYYQRIVYAKKCALRDEFHRLAAIDC